MIMLKLKPNILCKYDHALYKLSLAYVTPPALSPLPTFRVRSTCTQTPTSLHLFPLPKYWNLYSLSSCRSVLKNIAP